MIIPLQPLLLCLALFQQLSRLFFFLATLILMLLRHRLIQIHQMTLTRQRIQVFLYFGLKIINLDYVSRMIQHLMNKKRSHYFLGVLVVSLVEDTAVDSYTIGVILALSCAVFASIANISTAKVCSTFCVLQCLARKFFPKYQCHNLHPICFKCDLNSQLGTDVTTTVQLLSVGLIGIIVSGIAHFLNKSDRFFSSSITDISALEWAYLVGLSSSGNNCYRV